MTLVIPSVASIWLLLINWSLVSLSPQANSMVFIWLVLTMGGCDLLRRRFVAQLKVR